MSVTGEGRYRQEQLKATSVIFLSIQFLSRSPPREAANKTNAQSGLCSAKKKSRKMEVNRAFPLLLRRSFDSSAIEPCRRAMKKAPAIGRGSISMVILHFWLARLGLGVPYAASLGALSVGLGSRHIRCESRSGKCYCDSKSNNCCNNLIHRLLLCVTGTPLTRTEAGPLKAYRVRPWPALRWVDAVTE
jgi:hypothetical protein